MPRRWRVQPQWEGDDGRREAVYYSVCESYRDEAGVPRHRTLVNLGPATSPGVLAERAFRRAVGAIRMAESSEETVRLLEAAASRRSGRADPELDAEFEGWDEQNLARWRYAAAAWRREADEQLERATALEALHRRTVDPDWSLTATPLDAGATP